MSSYHWNQIFANLFNHSQKEYQSGQGDFIKHFNKDSLRFLADIGYKPREFFDYVEDHVDYNDIDPSTAILIASVRRDYFLTIQKGVASNKEMTEQELPARNSELGGIRWLPRIIQKARNKLRGENHPDIMYSCGGDRNFLKSHDIHPADFLRVVWAADDDDNKILNYVLGNQDQQRTNPFSHHHNP